MQSDGCSDNLIRSIKVRVFPLQLEGLFIHLLFIHIFHNPNLMRHSDQFSMYSNAQGINICIFREFTTCISFTVNTFPFIIHLIFLLLAAFSVVSFCPISPPLLYAFVECYPKKKVAPGNQLDTKKHSFHIFNWFMNLSFRKTLANAQVRYSCAPVMCMCVEKE